MKYSFLLPLSALSVLILLSVLISNNIIPPGIEMLESLQNLFDDYFYLLIVLIILLESIVYVGFYFPGQFFAVVLVVLSKPEPQDILLLTVAMVIAATIGSLLNYILGRQFGDKSSNADGVSVKKLLLAMIHMNSLAFFMFAQGANHRSVKVVLLAGLLNLPYYLLLIWGTSVMSDEIMQMAENTWFLVVGVSIWLVIAIGLDYKKLKSK